MGHCISTVEYPVSNCKCIDSHTYNFFIPKESTAEIMIFLIFLHFTSLNSNLVTVSASNFPEFCHKGKRVYYCNRFYVHSVCFERVCGHVCTMCDYKKFSPTFVKPQTFVCLVIYHGNRANHCLVHEWPCSVCADLYMFFQHVKREGCEVIFFISW